MKPIDITDDYYVKYNGDFYKKTLNLKLVIMLEFQNIKTKAYTPNWSQEVFAINKIKNIVPWTYVINDLNGEEITGSFYEKKLQKTEKKKDLEQQKYLKERVIDYMSHGKGIIIHLIVGLIKKISYKNESILS